MPLSSLFSSQKRNILSIALLVILILLAFSPALKAQFLSWNDNVYLTENTNVLNLDFEHLKAMFKQKINGDYIPLTSLSFSIENHFFRLNPFVYHLDNLLLHIATMVLAFFFVMTLGLNTLETFLVVFIFAVHPTKVESVVWISERKDLLFGFFFMASLLSYQKGKIWASFVFVFLSILANSMATALSIPLIMLGLDRLNGKRFSIYNIKLFALVVFLIGWKIFLIHFRMPSIEFLQTPLIWLWSLSFYIWKFLTPTISLPIYSLPKHVSLLSGAYIGSLLFLVLVFLGVWRLRKVKLAVFGFDFFFLSIFFLLHFNQWQNVSVVNDHSLYIPSIGFCILIVLGISKAYQFLKSQEEFLRHLFSAAVMILMLGLMLLTFNQSVVWQDTASLWKYQIKVAPHPFAYNSLAAELKDNHKVNIEEIVALYKKAIDLDSHYYGSYYNLAALYKDIGKFDEAMQCYNKVLVLDPKNKEALFGLGLLYQKMGESQASIDSFKSLLKFYPDDEGVYINVTDAYTKAIALYPGEKTYQEQREEVLSEYEELSKRKKYSALDYYNLGFLYEQVGGYDEAIRFYKKSLEINPTYEKALYNLANRYQEMGDMKTALFLYERLVHFHPRYSIGYLNMGVIYNALGDVSRARMLYQKAIDVDPHNAGGYFNLGFLSETSGDMKEALSYYEKAVEIDPQLAEGYYNLGNVYAAQGQNAEAIASYLKTVAINKGHQNAYVNLSILSFKASNFVGAIHYLQEAQKLGYTPPEEYVKSLEPYRKMKK